MESTPACKAHSQTKEPCPGRNVWAALISRSMGLDGLVRHHCGGCLELAAVIGDPGRVGGGSWAGASFDPDTQVIYVPSFTDWNLARLNRPETDDAIDGMPFDYVWNGDATPRVQGLPLFKPPYGRITAVDMRTGEHLWQIANGDGPRRAEPIKHLELPPPSTNALDFSIATKTLLFTATGRDAWNPPRRNVYDKQTGDLSRAIERPFTVRALPMTYLHEGGCTLPSQSGSVETRTRSSR